MASGSPPARAVLMTAKSLGINLDVKVVNLLKAEHKTVAFSKVIKYINEYLTSFSRYHLFMYLCTIDNIFYYDKNKILSI